MLARTLERGWSDPATWGALIRRHAARSAELAAFGYLLHASPLLTLMRGPIDDAARESAWRAFFQADILQVIAITLLALVLVAAALRSRLRFAITSASVGIAIALAAPYVRGLDASRFPVWLASYVTDQVPSQFPLFPWAGFAAMGAAIGALERNDARAWGRAFAGLSLGGLGMAGLLALVPDATFPSHDPWTVGPTYVFLRLGAIGVLSVALAHHEARAHERPSRIDRALRVLGQRSLLVYLVHVAVVYGRHPWSLRSQLGATLGFSSCFAVWALVTAAMLALAVFRGKMRRSRPLLLP